jgi:hypothetical protein
MVSRKKVAGFEVVIGKSGKIRFKRKPSAFNRYIADMLRGRPKVSKEEFTRIARSYLKPEMEALKEEIDKEMDIKLNSISLVMEDWNIYKMTEPKEKLLKMKQTTVERLRKVVC